MAHSIQVVNGRSETINDLDLLALCILAIRVYERNSSEYKELEELHRKWRDSCANYGPGTLDLQLPAIASDPVTRASFLKLATATELLLQQSGQILSGAELNRSRLVPGVRFADAEVSTLRKALVGICGLIEHAP